MYCPTCGLEHLEVRRFCNRCGTNLEAVSRALAGEIPDPATAPKLAARHKAMRRAFFTFCCGPVFSFSMLILSGMVRDLSDPSPWDSTPRVIARALDNVAFFGLLLMLVGVMMMINVFLVYGRKKDLVQQAPPQRLPESSAWPVVQSTPQASTASPSMPPSVTENTTFPLKPQDRMASRFNTSPTDQEPAPRPHQPVKEGH